MRSGLSMVTTTSSNLQSCQECVVLLTSEQEQAKDVIDVKKREIENIEIHKVFDMGQKYIST